MKLTNIIAEWFCGSELNEDNLCVDCDEAEAEENKEGD